MKATLAIAPCFESKSVLQKLKDEKQLRVISDATKSVCGSHGFQTLYDMPQELQNQIRWQILKDHLQDLKEDSVLTELSCFTWLADWMRWGWNCISTEEWNKVMDLACDCAEQYDYVFVAKDLPYKEYDGYSWLDKKNGAQITDLIKFLMVHLGAEDKIVYLD